MGYYLTMNHRAEESSLLQRRSLRQQWKSNLGNDYGSHWGTLTAKETGDIAEIIWRLYTNSLPLKNLKISSLRRERRTLLKSLSKKPLNIYHSMTGKNTSILTII